MSTITRLSVAILAGVALIASPCEAQFDCFFDGPEHLENPSGFSNHGVADSELAVGTERILTCSNSWLRLLDKNGMVIPDFAGSGLEARAKLGNYNDPAWPFFFPANAPQNPLNLFLIGDPAVYFDYENQRFWVVAFEGEFDTGAPLQAWAYSHLHVAVSTSAIPTNWDALTPQNPSGSWRKYDYCLFEAGVASCQSFDGLAHANPIAVDGDTLYIATFDDQEPFAGPRRSSLVMIDKDALMSGFQATPQVIELEDPPHNQETWGHVVAVEYDAWNNTHPAYTVVPSRQQRGDVLQDTILIGAIAKNGSTFTYESISLTGGNLARWFNSSPTAATPGGPVTLVGRAFWHATYRPDPVVGGRIWTCAHVRADVNGQPGPRNFVRYWEIHTNGWPTSGQNPTLAWSADISLPGLETYDPSIAVDAVGNIALSWTQSGPAQWPQFWMGAKRYFDPPGTLGETRMIADSTTTRTNPNQSIDYSGIDPDPVNGCRFWAHSALGESAELWRSHVGVLCLSGCEAAASYADQDENGVLDAMDTIIFTNRFQAQDRRADCNRDSELDVLDFVCFNDLFETARRQR